MSYKRIETEIKWGDVINLKGEKQYSEKYRIGYGSNGEKYRIKKRGGKYEAQCDSPYVGWENFIITTRTLKEMDKKLGEL